jgi:hypothetical protein
MHDAIKVKKNMYIENPKSPHVYVVYVYLYVYGVCS